jgi:hypothetical protein
MSRSCPEDSGIRLFSVAEGVQATDAKRGLQAKINLLPIKLGLNLVRGRGRVIEQIAIQLPARRRNEQESHGPAIGSGNDFPQVARCEGRVDVIVVHRQCACGRICKMLLEDFPRGRAKRVRRYEIQIPCDDVFQQMRIPFASL